MIRKIKDWIIKERYSILAVCVAIILTIILLTLTACKNFQVFDSEGKYPNECDLFITCLKYYAQQDADSAFVGIVYQDCKDAMRQERQKRIDIKNKNY